MIMLESTANCPVCSGSMLRHARQNRLYWYCSHCRQEMPWVSIGNLTRHYQSIQKLLPSNLIEEVLN